MDSITVWNLWDMLKFYAENFVAITRDLKYLEDVFNAQEDNPDLHYQDIEYLNKYIDSIIDNLKEIKLNVSLEKAISMKKIKDRQLMANAIYDLQSRIHDELKSNYFLSLSWSEKEFYEPKEPLFGKDVAENFPSIVYEIDQAGKCYACNLTTSSAFHSIRCLEAGIRALARCLDIPDPTKGSERNWSNLKRAIGAKIEEKWPAKTGRIDGDAKIFDEVFGALSAMQNPYRNSTMHLDAVYTAPEALHIFEMVKGLMQKISSRMDENGLPVA